MTSLRQRFIEDMQVRNFSLVTQASYTREVSGFARHFNKSPELLGPEQIRAYQIYLTNEKKLGVVSISVATSALRFLYRVTLKKNWLSLPIILSDAKAFEINDIQAYATSAPQPPDPIVTMLHWVRIALDGVFCRHRRSKLSRAGKRSSFAVVG